MSVIEFQEVYLNYYSPIFMKKIDNKLLFINIHMKMRYTLSLCELDEGIREISRIDFRRKSTFYITLALVTTAILEFVLIISGLFIDLFPFLHYIFVFPYLMIAILHFPITIIASWPYCAFIHEDSIAILYRDGLLRLFDFNGRLTSERKINNLDYRAMRILSPLTVCLIFLGFLIVWFNYPRNESIIISILLQFLPLTIIFLLGVSYVLYTFLFGPNIYNFMPYISNDYTIISHPEFLGRVKITIIDLRRYVSETFKIKLPGMLSFVRGVIFDKQLFSIILWSYYDIYLINKTTLNIRKILRCESAIVLVHWIREGGELFVVTEEGKIYLLDLYGNTKLLRDLKARIRFAAKIGNKVYFARK